MFFLWKFFGKFAFHCLIDCFQAFKVLFMQKQALAGRKFITLQKFTVYCKLWKDILCLSILYKEARGIVSIWMTNAEPGQNCPGKCHFSEQLENI